MWSLSAQTEPGDEVAVTLDIVVPDVIQEPAPSPDELHQSTPGVVITLVDLEVLGQVRYPLAEDGDLYLWRAGVGLVSTVGRDRCGFVWHEAAFPSGLDGDGTSGWATRV